MLRRPLIALAVAACGGAPPPPATQPVGPAFPAVEGRPSVAPGPPAPPPAEVRHLEAETYVLDLDAPAKAHQYEVVWVKVALKPLGDMTVQPEAPDWRLKIGGPADVFVKSRDLQGAQLNLTPAGLNLTFTLAADDPGVKHMTVDVSGTVCDADFCDTVTDQLSWNLEVE